MKTDNISVIKESRIMRKGALLIVITIIVSVIFSNAAFAELRWQAGVKGGTNWGKLKGDPVSLWLGGENSQLAGSIGDSKLGFTGGAFLTMFFNDFIGIQGEVMYIQKGGKGTASGTIIFYPPNDNPRPGFFNGTVSATLDYVEFPVMAIFEFEATEGGKVRLRGMAGPTFAFNIHAQSRLEGRAEVEMQDTNKRYYDIDEREDIGERVKNFEFGLIFGGAVYWDIGKVDLLIESRWERGLTSLDNTTLYRDIYTSNVSLMFGVSVPIGGER
jgi:hypothetical protein